MPVQTSYSVDNTIAQPGQLADGAPKYAVQKTNAEGASLPFGLAVTSQTAGTCELPDATGEAIIGINLLDHAVEGAEDGGVADEASASILRQGVVWVVTEETPAEGDAVFVRHTAGAGGSQLGAFRTDADTATADEVTSGMRWTGRTGTGVAELEVNLLGA